MHRDMGEPVTVAELLREVLPAGTRVLGGAGALGREVSWASALRLHGGFRELEARALALINLETLALLPAMPSLPQAIQALAEREVAAVAIRGALAPYQAPLSVRLAERVGCALLQLPPGRGANVSALEEAVNAYVARRAAPGDGASRGGGGPR